MKLNEKKVNILKGLAVVLLIMAFAFFSLKIADKTNHQTIDNINQEAEKRQHVLMAQLDSANISRSEIAMRLYGVEMELNEQQQDRKKFESDFRRDFTELKNLKKNEKNYITPATTDEQFVFIASYIYVPVE